MDCRTFRKHHVAYLDDVLPGELLVAAELHVRECDACATLDTSVRRGLMLVRNLAPVHLSPEFNARLNARLDDVRCGRIDVPDDDVPYDWAPTRFEMFRVALTSPVTRRRLATVAAGLVALTYAGARAVHWHADAQDVELAPVVASVPETVPMPALVPPVLLTSATTGIPVWPAALIADQAPAGMVDPNQLIASW